MFKLGKSVLAAVFVAAGMGIAPQVNAALLTFNYDISFGAVPSDGTAPWLRAVFDDSVGGGKVRLTLSAPGLSTDTGSPTNPARPEYADEWWFNLNPAKNADNLTFTHSSGVVATGILTPSTSGVGQLKADGDGIYDFRFNFPTGSLANGQTSVYDLALTGGSLSVSDFDFLSDPSGGNGPYLAAAHIQSTGVGNLGSDFVAPHSVPEPGSLALALPLLGALVLRRRRQ